VPPVTCSDDVFPTLFILAALWQNKPMPRWTRFLIAAARGLAVGLAYAWLAAPVQYIDTTPDTLHPDYKADYVLMVAEAFRTEQDTDLAARRLAFLSSDPPAEIVGTSIQTARTAGYSSSDLTLLENLQSAMLFWQPSAGGGAP
jgi:hypothetical protein